MDSSEIEVVRRQIGDRENKKVDFKLSVDLSRDRNRNKLAQDAISFANAEGGTIIIGVEDETRDIIGIAAPLDRDQIVQSITDLADPPVDVSVDTVEVNGKRLGIIKVQRGKAVHRLRNERTVYLRRDGINGIATPEEITQLSDERDYSSRVYLAEPDKLFSCDNGILMLSGEAQPYRKISKRGGLENLSECPLFLPEFSRWTSAPQFGDTKGSLMIAYSAPDYMRHNDFIAQVARVENQLNLLGRYIDFGLQGVMNWSISSRGTVCYGRGSQTLLKALEEGELGVISIAACGDFRGHNQQRSLLLLISGYCKSKEGNTFFVQDREIRLYLSSLPISNGWVRALFSPFVNEDEVPFSMLAYELVHPRLRVWRPVRSQVVPIRGTIGRYQYQDGDYSMIGAAIADTRWFRAGLYEMEAEWRVSKGNRDRGFGDLIEHYPEIATSPMELLGECIVSLTNPVPSYEDIQSGTTKSFWLPMTKHLELEVIGHRVHVLGLNASPYHS